MRIFNNIEELASFDEEIAEELRSTFESGDWENEQLYYHDSKEDFADHELNEGWYSYSGLRDKDWNGAPNPLDHIDLDSLGEDLVNSWDVSVNYLTSTGSIIQTSHGW